MVANVESARDNDRNDENRGAETGASANGAYVVEKLLCCLLGFDESALRTLRGLARLFRPSLTADWEFTDAWQDGCIVLLCNLDDPSTRDLWAEGSLGDLPLAVATSAQEIPDGWVLRKPLRGQGPNGLVRILNEAASGAPAPRSEPPAPQADPTGHSTIVPFRAPNTAPTAVIPASNWASPATLRPEPSAPSTATAVAGAPQQGQSGGVYLPAVAEERLPVGLAEPLPSAVDWPAIVPAPPPESRMLAAPEPEDPLPAIAETQAPPIALGSPEPTTEAEPVHDDPATRLAGHVTDALVAALSPSSFVAHAAADVGPPEEGMTVNVVPVSDLPSSYGTARLVPTAPDTRRAADEEAALRDRLRGLHAQPEPAPELQQDDFLALLNRLYRVRSIGIIYVEGLPPFCVVPADSAYYGRVTLVELGERLRENPVPHAVRLPGTLQAAMQEIDAHGLPPGQLKELFWLGNLRCQNAEQVARFEQGAYRLRRWPDLTQLPHERQHVNWCGLVARRPVTLQALAGVTGASKEELAAFLAACAALAILEAVEVTAEAQASAPVPQTARSKERVSIFRSLLNRLGFRRS